MTVLQEKIEVARPIEEVFAYVADFTTTQEWDATATEASKLTPGPIRRGTRFAVTCSGPVGPIKLEYKVISLRQDRLIELRGTSRGFDILDSIQFTPIAGGTQVDYRAEFFFKGLLKGLAPAFGTGLKRMGEKALQGMKEALEGSYGAPASSQLPCPPGYRLPGALYDFTRLGYRRARKDWRPDSAFLKGKHMVITGASSGLGYSAALELARRQASLTLVMRNEKKAAEVVENIRKETGNQDISVEIADLALLGDVELLAQRLLEQGRPIHALINNAGALFNERQETAEGIEVNLALLLLSPYRLTLALQPLLAEAHGSRVINVLSGGMYTQKLSVDSLLEKSDQTYQGAAAYAQAKRGLMVATEDLAQRWEKDGIVVNAMHPGWADTPGVESALPLFHRVTRNVLRSPEEGADTMVWLAAAGEAAQVSGQFFLDRKAVPVHLQGRTRETVQERSRLLNFLANYDWPEQVAVAEALGA